jgi:hypothetical protein
MRTWTIAWVAAFFCCSVAAAQEDLAAAMPADTVAYVRLTGLRAQWGRFFQSATWKRIEASPLPDVARGVRQAKDGMAAFEAQMNIKLEEHFAAVLGTDAAGALGADGNYLLLIRTADLPKLQATHEFFSNILRQQGRLVRENTERFEGVDLYTGALVTPNNPAAPERGRHYAVEADLFMLSGDLETLRKAVLTLKGKRPALAASPKHARAAELFRKDAFLRAYLDGEQLVRAGLADRLRPAFGNRPAGQWAFDLLKANLAATPLSVIDATGGERFHLRAVRLLDGAALPEIPGKLLPAPDAALELSAALPADALFSLAHQVDKAALWRAVTATAAALNPPLAAQMELRARQVATALGGLDLEKELLPAFGDGAALVGLPSAEGEYPALAVVIEIKEDRRLPTALRTLTGAAVVVAQVEAEKARRRNPQARSPAEAQRSVYKDVELMTVTLADPKLTQLLSPTFFAHGGRLVVATTASAARRMVDALTAPQGRAAEAGTWGALRIDSAALLRLFQQYRPALLEKAVADGKAPAAANKDLDGLQFILGLFEGIEGDVVRRADRIEASLVIR